MPWSMAEEFPFVARRRYFIFPRIQVLLENVDGRLWRKLCKQMWVWSLHLQVMKWRGWKVHEILLVLNNKQSSFDIEAERNTNDSSRELLLWGAEPQFQSWIWRFVEEPQQTFHSAECRFYSCWDNWRIQAIRARLQSKQSNENMMNAGLT